MKKTMMILCCVVMIPFWMNAQETTRVQEAGLIFRSLNNFGLTYKIGTEKSMWRINTLLLTGKTDNSETAIDSLSVDSKNTGISLDLGKEYYKNIKGNFNLKYGADINFRNTSSETNEDDQSITNNDYSRSENYVSTGLNLILGFNYVFNNNFTFGFEILPRVSYFKREVTTENPSLVTRPKVVKEASGFSYGLSNSSALISVTYRF